MFILKLAQLLTSSAVGLSGIFTPSVFSTTSLPLAWMALD
jgi:hypothetical protein